MNHKIIDEQKFKQKINALKYKLPDEITFLPENLYESKISSDFIYSETTTDIIKILSKEGIKSNLIDKTKSKYRSRRDAHWFGPIILISATMLYENPDLYSFALNILSDYVGEIFKGSFGRKKAKLDIIVETKKNSEYKRISYEGDPAGIKDLAKVIKSLGK